MSLRDFISILRRYYFSIYLSLKVLTTEMYFSFLLISTKKFLAS